MTLYADTIIRRDFLDYCDDQNLDATSEPLRM